MHPNEEADIVCVSVMDWEHPFQSSRHHLMRQLAQRHRVLFVDNQLNPLTALKGFREPAMRRKLATWSHLTPNPRQIDSRLWVYNPPPVMPMGKLTDRRLFEAAYAVNQRRLRDGVRAACKALGFSRPLLWISFNVLSSESLIGSLNERMVIYHCTDEITAMANTSPFAGEIERRLLGRSDLVFTSSRQLLADKSPFNANSHFVPNGADTELFERALEPELPVHAAIADLPHPLIGFAGHLEERLDFGLLASLARLRPDWHFAFAGPVSPSRRQAASELAQLPNVHMLGLLPREELPALLKGLDVALIPFARTPQTRAIYPLKLNEYLAAGKPVVLTPFADLREFTGLVAIAEGAEAFAAAIADELAHDSIERRWSRVRLARTNTWAARAAQMTYLINQTLSNRQSA
ncbi:MAG TPA: glycosyltransferase [Oscillatoriaceae cyanobacterium]